MYKWNGLEHLIVDSCTAAFIKNKGRIKISDLGRWNN
jgi:hypothetical protein